MTQAYSMKLIIHAGMAKTGSSSIQKTLWSLERSSSLPPGISYAASLGSWNNSNNLIRSFEGHEPEALGSLFSFLHSEKSVKILSAEVVSNPKQRGQTIRGGLSNCIRELDTDLSIYMYVRSPISYMTSLFVQMLKMGLVRQSGREFAWPCYTDRVLGIQELCRNSCPYKEASISFIPFKKELLASGNVVVDFAQRIGIELKQEHLISINESLSREAVSILYLENLERASANKEIMRNSPVQPNRHGILVDFLSGIGSTRLEFETSVFARHINIEDLEWMRCKLNDALDEPYVTSKRISLKDLEEVGRETLPQFNDKIVCNGIVAQNEISSLTVAEKINRVIEHGNYLRSTQ